MYLTHRIAFYPTVTKQSEYTYYIRSDFIYLRPQPLSTIQSGTQSKWIIRQNCPSICKNIVMDCFFVEKSAYDRHCHNLGKESWISVLINSIFSRSWRVLLKSRWRSIEWRDDDRPFNRANLLSGVPDMTRSVDLARRVQNPVLGSEDWICESGEQLS